MTVWRRKTPYPRLVLNSSPGTRHETEPLLRPSRHPPKRQTIFIICEICGLKFFSSSDFYLLSPTTHE
jgi:hypothetical protein